MLDPIVLFIRMLLAVSLLPTQLMSLYILLVLLPDHSFSTLLPVAVFSLISLTAVCSWVYYFSSIATR